jgi:hypothetical protein
MGFDDESSYFFLDAGGSISEFSFTTAIIFHSFLDFAGFIVFVRRFTTSPASTRRAHGKDQPEVAPKLCRHFCGSKVPVAILTAG